MDIIKDCQAYFNVKFETAFRRLSRRYVCFEQLSLSRSRLNFDMDISCCDYCTDYCYYYALLTGSSVFLSSDFYRFRWNKDLHLQTVLCRPITWFLQPNQTSSNRYLQRSNAI